jgi:hypothetical protein
MTSSVRDIASSWRMDKPIAGAFAESEIWKPASDIAGGFQVLEHLILRLTLRARLDALASLRRSIFGVTASRNHDRPIQYNWDERRKD